MDTRERRFHPRWWALMLCAATAMFIVVTSAIFAGTFVSSVPVTLTSERSGLIMETNAKVKMRGVQVGRVSHIGAGQHGARLILEIDPDQIQYIPANVEAEINVTTAFGAKFVELVAPKQPSKERLAAGAVVQSRNVTTEVNTVFENVADLLEMIDPAKLNAVLSAVADAVRGQGERMGQATTDLNQVLTALNDRSEIIRQDWRSFKNFNDTYAAAADDILTVLDAASTTSTTLVDHSASLDNLLLNVLGFADSGTNLLANTKDNLVASADLLEPTADLLNKYSPTYACMLQGMQFNLENGGYSAFGGTDGRTLHFDVALLLGNDPYSYPEHLPIVGAKGGPGGKPGCGSLPDVAKNFPVRQLVTNTGWGRGVDIRPNPGIGHPCYANWLPATRAVPEAPSVRQCIPGPAIGPVPYPGAPPYGAPLYGPGGVPLWPGVAPAQAEPGPARPTTNGQTPP
ncbi:MCE family protein [Mycolicibacterium pyrenivorans]|uniref:MCE family protein n=1 Tax=Mycolicibacterium pyrenivorans TaxID=187102 RepID=UPI0021F38FE4|nr:MCE family protein [Mycolicibacterium pyrenivorans]MCV7154814.1 MCE family protein [Mycolicibacterium pyrenivorans]